MADHDSLYHRLFSHPLMVEHLVRDAVPDALAAGVDFAHMDRVVAKFHDRTGQRRDGDVIWRLPIEGGQDVYLYLLLEFQSRNDWWMAVRAQVYEGLLWQHLIAERSLKAGDSASGAFGGLAQRNESVARWPWNMQSADRFAIVALATATPLSCHRHGAVAW